MPGNYKKSHAAIAGKGSALRKYQDVIVGSRSLGTLAYFELCLLLGQIPGALGLFLRKMFWPRLFGSCGRGVQFGFGVILRHPGRVALGDNVIVSEHCILDARSDYSDHAIMIASDVILSNHVMLSCKDGYISLGARTGVGPQTIIQSTNRCEVLIGEDVMIGPRCYVVGGGNYHTERLDVPMREQGIDPDSGVRIGNDVWLGANVTVLGGTVVGSGSVLGAGAVVTKSMPDHAICAGVPARQIRTRIDLS